MFVIRGERRMGYINFLGISACLLLNVAAYSSECWCQRNLREKNKSVKEYNTKTNVADLNDKASENSSKRILDWREIIRSLNPGFTPALQLSTALTHRDTYKRNNDGTFTLTKATIIIHELQKKFDLPDNPKFPYSESPSHNPLAWICSKEAITKAELTEEKRLRIGQYFLAKRLADDGVIERALAACMRNPKDNSIIIEFMKSQQAAQNSD